MEDCSRWCACEEFHNISLPVFPCVLAICVFGGARAGAPRLKKLLAVLVFGLLVDLAIPEESAGPAAVFSVAYQEHIMRHAFGTGSVECMHILLRVDLRYEGGWTIFYQKVPILTTTRERQSSPRRVACVRMDACTSSF